MIHAWYEEILQEKKKYLIRQTSVLDTFKSSSGTIASSPVLLDIGDDPDIPPTVPAEGPPS
jgi:hypothetical protein